MKIVNCPVCDSKEYTEIFIVHDQDPRDVGLKDYFRLVKCKGCNMHLLNPQPTKEELIPYYGSTYYGEDVSSWNFLKKIIKKERNIKPLNEKKGKLLDYGCGDGLFLELAKEKGWEVTGVEQSMEGAKRTSKRLGINVLNEEEFSKSEEQYDLITLWHVLEHVHEIDALLSKLKSLLKQDGKLFIAIPNIKCLQFKYFKKKTFHLDIPRHIWHFSPNTIKQLLQKHGYKATSINHYSFEYGAFSFTQGLYNTLTTVEHNYFYNKIKRNYVQSVSNNKNKIITYLLFPVFVPVGIIGSFIESSLKKGASIQVTAQKQ
ncbi:MAG: class I SAM-dependent methyltransferase [Nanoarchaeota archaeon]